MQKIRDITWGGAWGGSTYILMYLDVEIQKYCFSERKFNFRRNELLQCAPPMRHLMSYHEFFTYILCYTYLKLKKLYSYHIFWLLQVTLNEITKNHRFLIFRQNFRASPGALRRSKWLKMGWGCICTHTNMSISPKKMIFYSS